MERQYVGATVVKRVDGFFPSRHGIRTVILIVWSVVGVQHRELAVADTDYSLEWTERVEHSEVPARSPNDSLSHRWCERVLLTFEGDTWFVAHEVEGCRKFFVVVAVAIDIGGGHVGAFANGAPCE